MPVDTVSFWLKPVGLLRPQPGARRAAQSLRLRPAPVAAPARPHFSGAGPAPGGAGVLTPQSTRGAFSAGVL